MSKDSCDSADLTILNILFLDLIGFNWIQLDLIGCNWIEKLHFLFKILNSIYNVLSIHIRKSYYFF